MLDPRFYERLAPLTIGELEALTGAHAARGADRQAVAAVGILDSADDTAVAFCADAKFASALERTRAAACFLPEALAHRAPAGCIPLVTRHPQAAFAVTAAALVRERVHPFDSSAIHPETRLEAGVEIGHGAVIGPGAWIGSGTHIGAGAVIGPGVAIGRECRIGTGAKIRCALIGDRVHIHAGAAIGEPGFGAAPGPRGLVSLPQLGRAILQDEVRIGANSTVDRGAFDDTVLGERTKIDNLCHIGHNCRIGRDCVMAAYCGISGSVTIGDGCQLGGRVGTVDHITIGAGARIGAGAGVTKDVPAGQTWAGYPARPFKDWMRQTAWLTRSSARARRNEDD